MHKAMRLNVHEVARLYIGSIHTSYRKFLLNSHGRDVVRMLCLKLITIFFDVTLDTYLWTL